ncbi:helix-turn-helix transcriptional regulator [Leucobacter sp. cx-42]|uniref:helix-turn-helix domain-containing protein n=1 Tax=unclassified Leucobacter TaxID=2621730 RepID=UPI00165E8F5D|nr:helix-turn-helix transcriptional regulator [Leucobacter sp. cx-42]
MSNHVTESTAKAVREAIGQSGRSKRSISDETGIPYPTLNRKLSGKTEFTFRELFLLSDVLGVAPWTLTPPEFTRPLQPARAARWPPSPALMKCAMGNGLLMGLRIYRPSCRHRSWLSTSS